jgi:hypothetical protein
MVIGAKAFTSRESEGLSALGFFVDQENGLAEKEKSWVRKTESEGFRVSMPGTSLTFNAIEPVLELLSGPQGWETRLSRIALTDGSAILSRDNTAGDRKPYFITLTNGSTGDIVGQYWDEDSARADFEKFRLE